MSDIRVGDVCTVERRACTGYLDHTWTARVDRLTPKRAYMGKKWFALDDPKREVKPRYIDYTTVVVKVEKA